MDGEVIILVIAILEKTSRGNRQFKGIVKG